LKKKHENRRHGLLILIFMLILAVWYLLITRSGITKALAVTVAATAVVTFIEGRWVSAATGKPPVQTQRDVRSGRYTLEPVYLAGYSSLTRSGVRLTFLIAAESLVFSLFYLIASTKASETGPFDLQQADLFLLLVIYFSILVVISRWTARLKPDAYDRHSLMVMQQPHNRKTSQPPGINVDLILLKFRLWEKRILQRLLAAGILAALPGLAVVAAAAFRMQTMVVDARLSWYAILFGSVTAIAPGYLVFRLYHSIRLRSAELDITMKHAVSTKLLPYCTSVELEEQVLHDMTCLWSTVASLRRVISASCIIENGVLVVKNVWQYSTRTVIIMQGIMDIKLPTDPVAGHEQRR